ncbi:hypothetical protein PHMEG_00015157 [Phytophthora megakarya]|uniref:dUTPase-like domain-containing protein n=1 Tax=Phytophthora megakarya TaxID=4795 RepID=A0A225W1Z7_9STRA|nr:hypothetical protein PHMEG_00015157 [Phytophthora megakarya]
MDFMVPAGRSISLPNEVQIELSGRRQLYSDKAKIVNVGQKLRIQAGESVELPLRLRSSIHASCGSHAGINGRPPYPNGSGRTKYISITNIGGEALILHQDRRIGILLARDHWQNQALEATTDARSEDLEFEVPLKQTPREILQRPNTTSIKCRNVEASQDQDVPDCLPSGNSPSDQPDALDLDLTWDSDQDYDECVYYHEGSDLYAGDVDGQMAVLPEVPVTTEDVKIEDIPLCGSDNQTPEEIDRLRQRIWKFRHP